MLEELIEQGKNLKSEKSAIMEMPYFNTVEFEVWAAKSVNYLESEYCGSTTTNRVIEDYRNLNQNNNYKFYQLLQGVLESHK